MYWANWSEERIKEIQKYLGNDYKCCFLGFSLIYRKSTQIASEKIYNYELVLGYDSYSDIYVAWNPKLHCIRGDNHTFSIGKKQSTKKLKQFNSIFPIYKPLYNGNQDYEKGSFNKAQIHKRVL